MTNSDRIKFIQEYVRLFLPLSLAGAAYSFSSNFGLRSMKMANTAVFLAVAAWNFAIYFGVTSLYDKTSRTNELGLSGFVSSDIQKLDRMMKLGIIGIYISTSFTVVRFLMNGSGNDAAVCVVAFVVSLSALLYLNRSLAKMEDSRKSKI